MTEGSVYNSQATKVKLYKPVKPLQTAEFDPSACLCQQ